MQTLPAFTAEVIDRLHKVAKQAPDTIQQPFQLLIGMAYCGYGGQLKKELRLELLALASRCRQVAAQLPNLPARKEAVS